MDEDDDDATQPRGRDKRDAAWVELAKEDVGALWQQLLSSGQAPSDWTKEQLDDAFVQVQKSKHRRTAGGSVGTGMPTPPG